MSEKWTFQTLAVSAVDAASKIQNQVQSEYGSTKAAIGYWLMIDLIGSAAFRQRAHEEPAFRRALIFSRLIDLLAGGYGDQVHVFKHLGDGVLAYATHFRPLLEIVLLMDAVKAHWSVEVMKDPTFPTLNSRAAMTFGECLKVGDDYQGRPLDQVARLSAYASTDPDVVAVVSAEVRRNVAAEYRRQYPFVKFGETFRATNLAKPGETPPVIAEVCIDQAARRDFSLYFDGARAVLWSGTRT